jgi:hypothetical protein
MRSTKAGEQSSKMRMRLSEFKLRQTRLTQNPVAIKSEALDCGIEFGLLDDERKKQILVWIPVSISVNFVYCVLP